MDRNLQSPCHVRPLRCRRCCCDYWRRFRRTSEHSVSSSVANKFVIKQLLRRLSRCRSCPAQNTLFTHASNACDCKSKQGIGPRHGETICPPPHAAGSSTTAEIAADLRPSADGSAVRTFLVAGGAQAAANFFRLTGWFEQHYGCFSAKPKNI